jgi:MurNAc alpha-1-phosphate uridylyltransferase
METGGGIMQALPLLGADPFVVTNIDSIWTENAGSAIGRLAAGFVPGEMGARLLLAPMGQLLGFEGAGDFHLHDDGRIAHRGDDPSAEWAYTGVQIVDPAIMTGEPVEPFGFFRVWKRQMDAGRLYGAPLNGYWMHVGDPAARAAAEALLAPAA